jgi:hypothetical protein
MINEKEIKKAIETLKAQNANGELDQVIENLESQLTTSSAVNILLEEWNLTQAEYDRVVESFEWVKQGNNPFDTDFQMNDNQLKFLAHLLKEHKDYYLDEWNDRIESPMDYDNLYSEILQNVETYFDIDEKISNEFAVVSEEDIYGFLKANQEEEVA